MAEFVYQILQSIGYTHPLHPAVTHVPVGLTIGAFVFSFIDRVFKQPVLAQTARHCTILALIAAAPTIVLGYMDWQHFYAGAWLFPIKMKLALAGLLLILLATAVFLGLKPDKSSGNIIVYALCLVTVIGLGYFGGELVYGSKSPVSDAKGELAGKGAEIFNQKCSFCHFTDNTEAKVGPGLKGIFSLKAMPTSGLAVSDDNIRKQLKTPFKDMPPFADLSDENIEALIAYLKTL